MYRVQFKRRRQTINKTMFKYTNDMVNIHNDRYSYKT